MQNAKPPFRWYAQDGNGEFYKTLGGKRFGRETYATEDEARRTAVMWDAENRAADEDELRWGCW